MMMMMKDRRQQGGKSRRLGQLLRGRYKYMTGHLPQHTQQQWLSDSARHFPSLYQLYIYISSLSPPTHLCIILPKYTSFPFSFYVDMVSLGKS